MINITTGILYSSLSWGYTSGLLACPENVKIIIIIISSVDLSSFDYQMQSLQSDGNLMRDKWYN